MPEEALPRCGELLVGSSCPRSRDGVLVRALGGVVAADVTPCSLHAGSVRSCIFRIPTVHVPDANLQSLHVPTMIFTMSRPLPKNHDR